MLHLTAAQVLVPFVGEDNVDALYECCISKLHMFEWLVFCPL